MKGSQSVGYGLVAEKEKNLICKHSHTDTNTLDWLSLSISLLDKYIT